MATIVSTSELGRALITLAATTEFDALKTALARTAVKQTKDQAILDLISLLGQNALGFLDPA